MNLTFDNVLVTGGAGFIGSHLVEALVSNGCSVSVLDNLTSGSRANLAPVEKQIVFYKGDIRDPQVLHDASQGCEIIFHLAAEVSVPRTIEDPVETTLTNVMGTLSVLEAARKNKVKRVVFSSSCAVYGEGARGPKQERMRPEPLSPYAVQKLNGEFFARLYYELYGLETVCLRYFNVYGPRQDPSSAYSGVISLFLTRAIAAEKPTIYGDGNQFRDFIFVKDVVRANLIAGISDRAVGRIFNIATGRFIRINQLWEIISRQTGLHTKPDYRAARTGDIVESFADIEQAREQLGFETVYSFEKGIQITYDWYRSQTKDCK